MQPEITMEDTGPEVRRNLPGHLREEFDVEFAKLLVLEANPDLREHVLEEQRRADLNITSL